ncbi:MAG: hypothetical protein IT340_16640, partial [Chloroflexi bacterium]|nr:hypothetical protein [Chloroflexota bacterium]
MARPNERILVILGLAVIGGLLALTGYLGYRRVVDADAEQAAGATRVAALAPTWTASASAPRVSPMASVAVPQPSSTPASTASAPIRPPVTAGTPSPAPPPTAVSPSATVALAAGATATPAPGEWVGNRPLPPGPIPVNGPVLQRLQDGGRPGARTDQPGPGPELKERF